MKEYDIIVIGSGAGTSILEAAIKNKLKVALVDKGPAGGTCLNVGCIPSKMLIAVADRILEIEESKKFGIEAKVQNLDFKKIMAEMEKAVIPYHKSILQGLRSQQGFDFYESEAKFIEDYTLQIKKEKIKAKKIFIVAGSRPLIPKIKGLDKVPYLTNESLLKLKKIPKSLVIIGGGYIALEYAHFFSAIGTKVTILQKNKSLVPNEDEEVIKLITKKLQKRIRIETNSEVTEIKQTEKGIKTITKNKKEFEAEQILIAAGRVSNADTLQVSKTGIKTNSQGFIEVDDYFETSKKGIYAFGDIIGKEMFTHVSREEAGFAWHNAMNPDNKLKFDYSAVPHAIFTYLPIASVGLTEAKAKEKYSKNEILLGKAFYKDTAKGEALREEDGFAKAIIEKSTGKILGFHIIGPQAPELIQEIINVMATHQNINAILRPMHIHPALSELIQNVFGNLREIDF